MEASVQEEGGGDEALKLPAEECSTEAGTKLQKSIRGAAAEMEMELDTGSAEEGGGEEANHAATPAPANLPALGSCSEDEQLHLEAAAPMSYASTHTSDGGDALAAHGEDKKLQYTLRSNPKRSRRFLDPDYTLELASASAPPCAHSTTLPASTSPAPGGFSAPALPAPIKKGNSLFSEKARACTECGKQFPSWKALFGHMRCHPERQWRGIQPPTSISTLRDRSTIADRTAAARLQHTIKDADVECAAAPTKPLASPPAPSFWDQSDSENTIKALVSSRPPPRPSDYDVEESDTESIEAAYMNGRDQHHRPNVLNARGRGRRSKRSLQDVVSGGDGQVSESNTPPHEVLEERDMADCLVMLAFAAKSKADESDGDSALLNWKNHVRQSPLSEARKSMELKEKRSYNGRVQKSIHFLQEAGEGVYDRWEEGHDKGSWERKSKFECSTCKKTFRSHQALGGHRASHKKVKGCFARTNATEDGAIAPGDAAAEMSSIALTMATTVEDPHQQHERDEEDVFDPNVQQTTGDPEEQGPSPAPAPPSEEMSMGQFLQFSITCSEKMEEDQNFEAAIAPEKLQLKHQTSSCSSSSSIIAATAAAGTLVFHHHHPLQLSQQPKIHQCSICNRVFSTGQALGGHKRCHWGGSGMPETGKKCPLMRQDSDGVACAMGIVASDQRTSEFSRKGRQDSGSFASAEANWMNISLAAAAMEKDFTHISGLSNKGRQDSVASCDEVKASANSWLGGYVACEKDELDLNKVMMGGRAPCQERDEGMSAERGWLEASSSKPKLSSKNQLQYVGEGGYKQQGTIACELDRVQGGAGEERGRGSAEAVNKGSSCECSRGVENGEGESLNEQVPALMKMEDMLDLNLPAPAEEEEEKERARDSLPLTASDWLSSKEPVAKSAGR